jgi:hypothetical protein
VLNNTLVHDSTLNQLGKLPSTTLAVALKGDGTRAYTLDSSGKVRTFDLTGPLDGSGVYPEVGSGTTIAGTPGANTKMTISPDEGTLFMAGEDGLVIQPIP